MSRRFLYCLMDEQNRFYYENNGGVSISTVPKPLTYTPNKWLDIEIERQRNANLFALDRTFTVPLEFVRDGARIVKHIYYNQWIEGKLFLAIMDERLFLDETHYGFYYSLCYKGEIDFSQFDHDGPMVILNVMEGGPAKLLKANLNTKYEIPVAGGINVALDGIKLKQKANWVVGGIQDDNHILPMTFVSQEAITSIGAASQEGLQAGNSGPDLWDKAQRFLTIGVNPSTIKLTWDFTFSAEGFATTGDNDRDYLLQLIILKDAEIVSNTTIQQYTGTPDNTKNKQYNGTTTFTAPANSRVVLFFRINNFSAETEITYHPENSLILAEYDYRHVSSIAQCLRPIDLLKALCAKMGITKVQSVILETVYKNVVLTSGDAIRGIEGAVIKTSLNDFFKSMNTLFGAAMGVHNGVLLFENKNYFVNYSSPIDLGPCKNPKIRPATEYIYNTVKIGYPDQNYQDVNGKYEFNTTHVYTLPVTRIAKELDLVSVYRADSYGIEFTRINLDGKTTTDSSSDNDVFMIHIEDKVLQDPLSGFKWSKVDRSLNAYATGLPEATVFNLWLSPKQCLFRNGDFIASCFYRMNAGVIKFQTNDKATALQVQQPGKKLIDEDGDVEIKNIGTPLFTPNLIEFENKVPYDLQELLKPNPLRSFKFTIDGIEYIGFPVKDSIKPGNDEAQTFTVLSAPSNSLEKLIEYYG